MGGQDRALPNMWETSPCAGSIGNIGTTCTADAPLRIHRSVGSKVSRSSKSAPKRNAIFRAGSKFR
jgi:hypothetical protein